MNVDLKEKKFMQMKLFNKPVLFSYMRIDNDNLPKNIYKYEVRSDDEGLGIICELSNKVLVNFWGTVLSNKPIQLNEHGFLIIDEDKDIKYLDKESITIKQYLEKQFNKDMQR